MMNNQHHFLKVVNIRKSFQKKIILKDVSFTLDTGKIMVLVGENGAGKSTLLSILTTLSKPDSGEVLLNNQSIIKTPALAKGHIAYVPQEIALHNHLSVRDNLYFWASIHGIARTNQTERVGKLLEEFRLTDYHSHKVGKLSVGLRRKVSIAIALLSEAKLLIMDEPTAGLDKDSRHEIITNIKQLKEQGIAIIYVTHIADEIERLADTILQISDGIGKIIIQ